MPGMPIFQDTPSQLKGQIYVLNSTTSAVEPLKVDTTGNLNVAGTVGLATGAEVGLTTGTTVGLDAGTTVGLAAGTEEIGTVGLATGTTVGLAAGTEEIGTVGLATGTTVGLAAGTEEIGTVGLATGTTVGLAAGTEEIGTVGLATGTTVGLAAGTEEIGTVGLAAGTEEIGTVGLATGTTVGLAEGTNIIGSVRNDLVFTSADSFGGATILTPKSIGATSTVNSDTKDISKETSYNWFIKNNGTAANQNISLKVYLSANQTDWVEDTGTSITVAFGTSKMITVNNFLQYTRFVITGGVAETTVVSCYQSQH
jgi:uncharacterized protein DUF6385